MNYTINLKRVYTTVEALDDARILVDRIWPRGRTRETLALTEWFLDVAPSSSLSRKYHQQQFNETSFEACYRTELREHPDTLLPLMRYAREGVLTLLSACRNTDHSHLPVLKEMVLSALAEEDAIDCDPSSPPCWAHEWHEP